MKIKFFTVPVFGGDALAVELNNFISSHGIIQIERQFVANGSESVWSFCISYQDTAEPPIPVKRGKIDYREVLSESDFTIYSQLRDLRKQIAEQEGVPVYALFTNEQLASMVTQRIQSATQLGKLEGVGAGRIEKYGTQFLQLLQEIFSSEPAKLNSHET